MNSLSVPQKRQRNTCIASPESVTRVQEMRDGSAQKIQYNIELVMLFKEQVNLALSLHMGLDL